MAPGSIYGSAMIPSTRGAFHYSEASIRYRKFDAISEEKFKLGAGVPLVVQEAVLPGIRNRTFWTFMRRGAAF